METPVESELVEAAQVGDEHALGLLLRRYLPLVHNLVRRALPDDPDSDDVVQETLLRVVRALPSLRDPERFRPWLMAIAIREVQQRERSRARVTGRETPLAETGDRPDPALDFVDLTILELGLSGQRREVTEASRWLPPSDRPLLALWWQEVAGVIGRPELAEASGVSQAHAAVRVQRMRARLEVARVVVRALEGRHRCRELFDLLRSSGPVPDSDHLVRVSRHVRHCERCQVAAGRLVPPEKLLAGVALLPVSMTLLQRLPELLAGAAATGHSGLPAVLTDSAKVAALDPATAVHPVAALKSTAVAGAVATTLAVSLGFAVHHYASDDPRPSPGPVPAVTASAPSLTPSPATRPTATPTPTTTAARAAVAGVTTADLYVAPGGDDDGPGTIGQPFATLSRAVEEVRPGQTIALRGGRYRPTERVVIRTDGTSQEPIVLSNYRDEVPTFDAGRVGGSDPFVTHEAAHWRVQGLEITNAPGTAYHCRSCRDDTFRRLSIHGNQATGFTLKGSGTSGNRILDSDFHDNHDDADHGADADGLVLAEGDGEGNVIAGCRFFENADDGFDIEKWTGSVTVEGNWAYGNGVNRWGIEDFEGAGHGFRLGARRDGAAHVVTGNAAWDNTGDGFGEGSNESPMRITRNTAYHNGGAGFWFEKSPSVLERNLSLDNGEPIRVPGVTGGGNSWDGNRDRAAILALVRSTDATEVPGPRRTRATSPSTVFLRPVEGIGADMRLRRPTAGSR